MIIYIYLHNYILYIGFYILLYYYIYIYYFVLYCTYLNFSLFFYMACFIFYTRICIYIYYIFIYCIPYITYVILYMNHIFWQTNLTSKMTQRCKDGTSVPGGMGFGSCTVFFFNLMLNIGLESAGSTYPEYTREPALSNLSRIKLQPLQSFPNFMTEHQRNRHFFWAKERRYNGFPTRWRN
jgi:hypothetical protein